MLRQTFRVLRIGHNLTKSLPLRESLRGIFVPCGGILIILLPDDIETFNLGRNI